MKKLFFAGAAAALTLVASNVRAETATGSDTTMMNKGDTNANLMGTVKDVDTSKNLVTIQVPLAPGAPIMKEGQTVGLNKLKKGDDVRASFDPSTNTITQINVQPKGTMKHMNQ